MRFRAEQHLRRQLDFQHVRTNGRRHECGAFTLWYVRQAAPVAVGEPKPGENPDVVTKTTSVPSAAPAVSIPAPISVSSISPAASSLNADTPVDRSKEAPVASSAAAPGQNRPSAPTVSRLGVVASRSAVGNAIARARAKRRLREVFRGHQQRVPAGYDLLLVARGALNRLEYREIEKRFVDACSKIFPSAKA